MAEGRLFYGWVLVAVGFVVYGFGISPAFYGWGFYQQGLIEEFGFTRAQLGGVFGLFTFVYSAVGPLVGLAVSRWGLRVVMAVGSFAAAVGFALMSRVTSLVECYAWFAVLGGIGIGFSTIVPGQTLASNWFVKYRARAVALIFIAGGIVGLIAAPVSAWVMEHYSWRQGWFLVALVSAAVGLLAAGLVRNVPEDLGLKPDGAQEQEPRNGLQANRPPVDEPDWTAGEAIRTPQFLLMIGAAVGYALPWGVVVSQGPLHLNDLGIPLTVASAVIGIMAFASIFGRLSGALGDFFAPQKVLGAALVLETVGMAGLLVTDTLFVIRVCTICIALGFGASYISVAVVFSSFFGRRAFATTAGTRILITGIFNALGPPVAGWTFDTTGSYTIAFLGLIGIGLAGAVCAFVAKPPTRHQA